jgi:hypothetical protein
MCICGSLSSQCRIGEIKHGACATTFCISRIGAESALVFVGRKAIARAIWRTMLVVRPVREIPMNFTGRLPVERMVRINLRTCSKAKGRAFKSIPWTSATTSGRFKQACSMCVHGRPRFRCCTSGNGVHTTKTVPHDGRNPSTASFPLSRIFHPTPRRCALPCTHPKVKIWQSIASIQF